ncbi:hypothetical protein ATCC90586_007455 [Pythium insidiosum]|nr:hypothetical protein ATCC90586_007455 [Pythium insidiosum]
MVYRDIDAILAWKKTGSRFKTLKDFLNSKQGKQHKPPKAHGAGDSWMACSPPTLLEPAAAPLSFPVDVDTLLELICEPQRVFRVLATSFGGSRLDARTLATVDTLRWALHSVVVLAQDVCQLHEELRRRNEAVSGSSTAAATMSAELRGQLDASTRVRDELRRQLAEVSDERDQLRQQLADANAKCARKSARRLEEAGAHQAVVARVVVSQEGDTSWEGEAETGDDETGDDEASDGEASDDDAGDDGASDDEASSGEATETTPPGPSSAKRSAAGAGIDSPGTSGAGKRARRQAVAVVAGTVAHSQRGAPQPAG